MLLKLVVLFLSSSQVTSSLNIPRTFESHARWDHKITYYADCIPVSSIAKPPVITTPNKLTSSAVWTSPTTDVTTIISSSHPKSTESHHDHASLAAISHGTSVASALHTSITSHAVSLGQNGTPACAYILAADMGPHLACPQDHCDCDGTIAPLISSSASGSWTTNCDYAVQPPTSSCPAPTSTVDSNFLHPSPSLVVIETVVLIQPVCTATVGGGETCGYKTSKSVTTIGQ